MRVLMLSKACGVGLYQRKLEYIAAQVSALEVIVPPFWKDERGKMPLERAHIQGYSLTATPIRFNGHFHLHYYPAFHRLAADFKPDIIHIDEEPYNLATYLALRIGRQLRAKSLFFSWQNIYRRYPPPFSWGENWVLKQADYAIFGTQSAAEVGRQKGYKGKSAIIPQFGIDPEAFGPRLAAQNSLIVGYVGRLVPEKGIDLILQALANIPHDWRLWLVGGGPEETPLRELAQRLGISERVIFRGQVPSVEMPNLYPQFDILVLPSRTMPNWKEQFGRALTEAMASQVAVIGSDSGAIPDVIGNAGLIFPENDAEKLDQALQSLMQNPELRKTLGRMGRERVLANFTQEQVAQQTVQVYQEMLA